MKTNVPGAHDHDEAATVLRKLGRRNPTDAELDLAVRLLDIGYHAGARNVRDELTAWDEAKPAVEIIDANGFA